MKVGVVVLKLQTNSLEFGDFVHEGVDYFGFRHLAQGFATRENDATFLSAGHANIGMFRFAWAIYHTTHDRHLNRLGHRLQATFHLLGQTNQVHLTASARGAANNFRSAPAQVKGRKQGPARTDFLHGVVGERNSQGVANAFFQQNA